APQTREAQPGSGAAPQASKAVYWPPRLPAGGRARHAMKPFVYDQPAVRVVFGVGCLDRLEEEVERMGARRALVLATPDPEADARALADRLGTRAAGIFARARMHVPVETAREASRFADERNADVALAIGGGSTIGLAKAIALESGRPILAVPTTYAGSEMTPI